MKLLHIISSMDPANGGPSQGIRNTNPGLMHHGISREVVTLDDPTSGFLGTDDFPVHALGPAKGPWQYSSKLKPWLKQNMSRFDVVVINGLWVYSSYAGWSVSQELKKKVAQGKAENVPRVYVMPHGMLDPYFQRAPERRLKAIRNWIYWKLFERRVVNDADGLLFTCQRELELAREAFSPYHPKQDINVGYGILAPPANENASADKLSSVLKRRSDRPFVLFFSRIHHKKGVDLLIEGYAKILNEAIKDDRECFDLVIAGPGMESAYGKRVKQLIKTYSVLEGRVFMPGMLTGSAKWAALYNCEAFVLPSHQENFGIAVVEALACGKPVMISDQINIYKEILDGEGGMVAADTKSGITDLLRIWLHMSAPQKAQMGANAVETFKKYFTVENSVSKLVRVFMQR